MSVRKSGSIATITAAVIGVAIVAFSYLDVSPDPNQIWMREKMLALGSKISAEAFVEDQLDTICFDPIVNHREILRELQKETRFYVNYNGERTADGFSFLIFTGVRGPKYAMVRHMDIELVDLPGRTFSKECWPLTSITIELTNNYRDVNSSRGIEEIGVKVVLNTN